MRVGYLTLNYATRALMRRGSDPSRSDYATRKHHGDWRASNSPRSDRLVRHARDRQRPRCRPASIKGRQRAPEAARERQSASTSVCECLRAHVTRKEHQRAPESARTRQRAPESARGRQRPPRGDFKANASIEDRQRAPESASERQRAPERPPKAAKGRFKVHASIKGRQRPRPHQLRRSFGVRVTSYGISL